MPRGTQDLRPQRRLFAYGTVTPCGGPFQSLRLSRPLLDAGSSNPAGHVRRFGLLRFRSPLLAESSLFLWVLRCFSSPGSPRPPMGSADDAQAYPRAGFPIRASPAQTVAHPSPRLFAVYHALLRLLSPRHPPYALSSFALRDSEKLKFPFSHYSLVKVPANPSARLTRDSPPGPGSVTRRCPGSPPPAQPPVPHPHYDNSPASRRAAPPSRHAAIWLSVSQNCFNRQIHVPQSFHGSNSVSHRRGCVKSCIHSI